MRKGLLSSVATALVGAGSALAQTSYLPGDGSAATGKPGNGLPVLLSAEPAAPAAAPSAPPALSCGSTGLVPGVDCLPASVPEREKSWVEVSYLVAWIKNGPNPGLLGTASPVGATIAGPATVGLVGGRETEFDYQSGFRVTAGTWFGCDNKVGFEASGFLLEQTNDRQTAIATGAAGTTVNLFRPFFNANTRAVNGILLGGPGVAGGITSESTSRFWGAEGNGIFNWSEDGQRRNDLLVGFTYFDLLENMGVNSVSSAAGGRLILNDAIDTRNQFYGGQVGMRSTWTRGRLSIVGTSKIALGWTHEVVDRFGSSATTVGTAAPVGTNTGFLVHASNRGRITDDRFAVALPSNLSLDYQVTDHMTAFLGYDFVYLSRTVRPGDQTDLTLQTTAAGASVRPLGGLHVDDFWMNAFQVGVKFKF